MGARWAKWVTRLRRPIAAAIPIAVALYGNAGGGDGWGGDTNARPRQPNVLKQKHNLLYCILTIKSWHTRYVEP